MQSSLSFRGVLRQISLVYESHRDESAQSRQFPYFHQLPYLHLFGKAGRQFVLDLIYRSFFVTPSSHEELPSPNFVILTNILPSFVKISP